MRIAAVGGMLENVHTVLVGTTHPGNVGAAARALKTMGLSRLHLVAAVAPDEQARANAGSAGDVLDEAKAHTQLASALARATRVYGVTARPRRYGVPALAPRQAAEEIATLGAAATVAVVYGREHSGLTNAETGLCHRLVHIPANPEYASLNLAAAVQVVSYELRCAAMGAAPAPGAEPSVASAGHLAGLYEHLARVMAATGYAADGEQRHLLRRLQRLFNRAVPEQAEVNILRGLLAAVERRLGADGRD